MQATVLRRVTALLYLVNVPRKKLIVITCSSHGLRVLHRGWRVGRRARVDKVVARGGARCAAFKNGEVAVHHVSGGHRLALGVEVHSHRCGIHRATEYYTVAGQTTGYLWVHVDTGEML